MKLHLTTSENHHLITAYDAGIVKINKQDYKNNLIVMPEHLILDWYQGDFSEINAMHLSKLETLKPEVVLLGTGLTHAFLHPKHYHNLTNLGIPLECMTTAAACRTYNILMSEGRNVAAALLLK
jgi:uncharacterized protein